ncbi:MAG: NAD(P)/FAD-dependent oxidoreductase [Thermodesulfovibrionales bacterium]|nr:NAD(P)/FAD-dependent oxidoreductase [Nitrospinota bacterium]MCG2710628.1 NAD(P)/FAD-dependent oxidoreductase [Thermodesulfovibrionales bacterium]
MAKIIVLGGSFGGLTAAFELKRLLGKTADITLLSDMDKFVFIPSLPWLAMGWRKPEDITVPLKPILERKGITFIHEEVKGVDAESSKVVTASKQIAYDYLVIATGPHLAFEEVPGLGPDKGHTECIFTLEQAERANKAWNKFLEEPGAIVTGSVQGVSCFGPPYEYAFEIDYELRRMKIRHKVPIVFVTSEPYIGHFGIGGLRNSKRIMEDEFAKRDIKVITNIAVEEFASAEMRLKDGTKIPFKLAMFAPAMKGVPAVAHLGNPRGFIPVDGKCRHTKHKNIFAVGVAVAIAPPEQTPVPTGVPKTGYMTVKMAKTAAYSIASEISGSPAPASYEMDVLCLMDMGNTAALMRAKPLLPPRQESALKSGIIYKWSKAGFEKYFLWKIKHGLSNWP